MASAMSRAPSPTDEEYDRFHAEAEGEGRIEPADGPAAGYTEEEAADEVARGLHCDGRKPESCALRRHAERYGASPTRFRGEERRTFIQHAGYGILYEPGKCIDCGICVRIAEEARKPLGLTFVGRGFEVRAGVPFDGTIDEGLREAAWACARACPRGAIAFRDAEE
jgi:predicted molibdopterin-dependent oxidoreductase YjgC